MPTPIASQNPSKPNRVSRFAGVLSSGDCARPLYDQVLAEIDGCVVTPTLGSIVPNWLLVIPRCHAMNFASWSSRTGAQAHDLIDRLAAELRIDPRRLIWFEHGAAEVGSEIGCGLDHAHIHIIFDAPFLFQDIVLAASTKDDLRWQSCAAPDVYRSLAGDKSYLVAGSEDRAILAHNVEQIGSQFFRKIVASLVAQTECWNYKTHPYLDNVQTTLKAFGIQAVAGEHSLAQQ